MKKRTKTTTLNLDIRHLLSEMVKDGHMHAQTGEELKEIAEYFNVGYVTIRKTVTVDGYKKKPKVKMQLGKGKEQSKF